MARYMVDPIVGVKGLYGHYYYGDSYFQAIEAATYNHTNNISQKIFLGHDEYKFNPRTLDFETLEQKKKEDSMNYDLTDDGTGKKYDNGKPMIGTAMRVFPLSMEALGAVIEFGTHKYPQPDNWKRVEGANYRYLDSLMRHLIKHLKGQELDEETSKPHLAHVVWNALAILELYLMNKEENNNA